MTMADKHNIKNKLSSLWEHFKAFFLTNRKNALVFLLCLFISFGCWMAIMQNKTYEVWVNYPLQYKNAPPDVELYADLTTSLNIRVRDKAKSVFPYRHRNFRPAVVDFNNSDLVTLNGNNYTISFTNVFEEGIKQNFAQSTVIVDYFPKDLSFEVVPVNSKKLPIKLNVDVNYRKQFHLSDSISMLPDSITLYARQSVLDTINEVNTHLLKASNLNDTLKTSLGLSLPPRTKAVPKKIDITIPVEAYTEGSQNVPVTVKNLPKKLKVRTFPEQIKVKYLVGISKYSDIEAKDFGISIDYDKLIESRSKNEFVDLDYYPSDVKNCKLYPPSVEWMIEVVED